MFTIFACPKPFTDPHIAIIQRNAITSWTLLRPKPEIILFGDEPGVGEICEELGLRHVPEVARNEFGTPLLNDIFAKAQQIAEYDLLCYINADVILMSDFIQAIFQVQRWEKPFLLAGEKRDVEITEIWDFSQPDWEARLRSIVLSYYKKNEAYYRSKAKSGAEFFVFRRGMFSTMPPFSVGRWAWDGWLLWQARHSGADVIDATPVVMAVHQLHGYSHISTEGQPPWLAEEAVRNLRLSKLRRFWFLWEANYIMTPNGIKRVRGQKLKYWCKRTVADWLIYRLGPIRHVLGLRRANFERLKRLLYQ